MGIDYLVVIPIRDILALGIRYAVDESCLSSKIFLGHVAWLKNRCDAVLCRALQVTEKAGTVCTKFAAIYDVCANTFRSDALALLHYGITTLKNRRKSWVLS